jgi:hypothetical protein
VGDHTTQACAPATTKTRDVLRHYSSTTILLGQVACNAACASPRRSRVVRVVGVGTHGAC